MSKAEQFAENWTANAIEECRNDPTLAAMEASGELCITCMCSHPCICDNRQIVADMRRWYESHRVSRGFFDRPKTEIVEPKLIGSWGRNMDGLMTGLLNIMRKPYEAEIARLRKRNAK